MTIQHLGGVAHFNKLGHMQCLYVGGGYIIVYPPDNSGGGPYPMVSAGPGYYSLDPRFLKKSTRYIMIGVDFKDGKKWKKHYVVDADKADIIITVVRWINTIKEKITIGGDKIRKLGGVISTVFTKDDK